MWRIDAYQLAVALAVDLILGDPQHWPHVARAAGALSLRCESGCVRWLGRTVFAGIVFWVLVCTILLGAYALVHTLLARGFAAAAWLLDVAVVYQCVAARDLDRHARAVLKPLMAGDLEAARFQLSRIVGRDTAGLDASEVSRATLETVAESTTDGVLAPLFWAAVGGPAAALLYRTANTLDSMVGHRDARYERFGKCSALADDVLSFVPARLCALLSLLTRGPQHAVAVVREAGLHASPNAGWSEAAAAWALRVRLGGTNHYDGIPQRGPVFNPGGTAPQANDVKRILLWFWTVTSVAGVAFTLLVHWRSTLERSRVPNHPVLPGVVETAPQQRIVRDRPFPPRRAVALPEVAGTQASFFW